MALASSIIFFASKINTTIAKSMKFSKNGRQMFSDHFQSTYDYKLSTINSMPPNNGVRLFRNSEYFLSN